MTPGWSLEPEATKGLEEWSPPATEQNSAYRPLRRRGLDAPRRPPRGGPRRPLRRLALARARGFPARDRGPARRGRAARAQRHGRRGGAAAREAVAGAARRARLGARARDQHHRDLARGLPARVRL